MVKNVYRDDLRVVMWEGKHTISGTKQLGENEAFRYDSDTKTVIINRYLPTVQCSFTIALPESYFDKTSEVGKSLDSLPLVSNLIHCRIEDARDRMNACENYGILQDIFDSLGSVHKLEEHEDYVVYAYKTDDDGEILINICVLSDKHLETHIHVIANTVESIRAEINK